MRVPPSTPVDAVSIVSEAMPVPDHGHGVRGGAHDGGSAGFGIAADNDAPMAAKGQIVASAFLGVEMQCARCHDSPYHTSRQRDLYSLAAMFDRKPATVPKTSRVPEAFFEKNEPSDPRPTTDSYP